MNALLRAYISRPNSPEDVEGDAVPRRDPRLPFWHPLPERRFLRGTVRRVTLGEPRRLVRVQRGLRGIRRLLRRLRGGLSRRRRRRLVLRRQMRRGSGHEQALPVQRRLHEFWGLL